MEAGRGREGINRRRSITVVKCHYTNSQMVIINHHDPAFVLRGWVLSLMVIAYSAQLTREQKE